MTNEAQNGNIAKPLLAAGAIKEAVEILSAVMNMSLHFSKYPQDKWKNESEPPEISRLISTAEFHNKRWQEIKSVIDHLVAVDTVPTNEEIDLIIEQDLPFSEEYQKYSEKEKTIMLAATKAGAKWFRSSLIEGNFR